MLVEEPVHAAIWHCLNHYDYRDATFLAERLFTEVGTDESLFLLATCYFRNGQLHQAYDILRKHESKLPKNRFLLAKCCLKLDKIHEAELSLVNDVLETKAKDVCDEVVNSFQDVSCFALQTLANIYSRTERLPRANEADRRALKLNPLLWNSFENLCQRGDFVDPDVFFSTDKVEDLEQCTGSNHVIAHANRQINSQNREIASAGGAGQLSVQQPYSVQHQFQSNLPQPRMSLLATPSYPTSRVSSTSTPILPIASVQTMGQQSTMSANPQPVILVTPIAAEISTNSLAQTTSDGLTLGSDSCFTASPASVVAPSPMPPLQMSGIGMLSFNSDTNDKSYNTSSTMDPVGRAAMPPPPMKPKPVRRHMATALLNESGSLGTPPTTDKANIEAVRGFGRFPRGALIWSSDGKRENVSCMSTSNLLGPSRLDFSQVSPLSVLSPQTNPSTPFSNNLQTPKSGGGPVPLENSQPQQTTSSAPLINATNSEHKIKPRPSHNENSTPLKQSLFGQSSQNQNTPANNLGSGNSVRRSSRLFTSSQQPSIKAKENTKTPGQNVSPKGVKSFKSPSKKSGKSSRQQPQSRHPSNPGANSEVTEMNEKNKLMDVDGGQFNIDDTTSSQDAKSNAVSIQKHCLDGLLCLFRHLGEAYLALSHFQCEKAVKVFEDIEPHHQNTAWVIGSIGKAYFEMGDYAKAKTFFQKMRDLDPHRTEFTEYFSTTLWHLQEEVDLSALAQELTSAEKMEPQSWCAAGNCFSLQKEHENAIKFFQRASQVDPEFAYSYTLLGHEYITIEELDKALTCFRTAVRIDPRHYNAWYGIGLVFYKQERFQLAEIYYKKAVDINPQSPVLMCHLAVVQHALQKTDKAMETLEGALQKAPQNPLCKFERASILFSVERFDEALVELKQLKVLVPKESPVYFLMGKVHNKLNNTHKALMHFSWAMDLDPKGANSQIKDALDRSMNKAAQENADAALAPLDDEEEDDDEEMLHDGPGIA